MTTYCWKCLNCGYRDEGQVQFYCPVDNTLMNRDYRAENAGFAGVTALRKEREGNGREALRDLFLPTEAEMATSDDPTGQKGMQEWNERHVPAESNKQPLRPKTSKQVF